MWIVMNDAYLSIVEDVKNKDNLLVRARIEGDLERAMGVSSDDVLEDAGTDYRFRVTMLREDVADIMARHVREIDYRNFKDSVEEDWRHDAYADIWGIMYTVQNVFRRVGKMKQH